jgi:hypothetical protein
MVFTKEEVELYEYIFSILSRFESGISEFELIQEVKKERPDFFPKNCFDNNYELFVTNFLLFHTLYRMRKYLNFAKKKDMEIHFLKIQMIDSYKYEGFSHFLAGADPLEEYYSNLENLKNTTHKDIDDMLDSFWKKYVRYDKKKDAFLVLGLDENVNQEDVEKRYREMVKIYHPDRGGSIEQVQKINEAIRVLRRESEET